MSDFHVYIFRDADMRALYVGQTRDLRARMRAHSRSPFASDVALVSVIPCESRDDALAVERHYIWTLRPSFNKYGSPARVTVDELDERGPTARDRKRDALARLKAAS